MPDTINGIPTHPLLVHFGVVLTIVAGVLGVLWIVPRTRRWATHAFPLTAVAATIAVFLAKESGEGLEERVESGTATWDGSALETLVEEHAEAADLMFVLMLVFALVAIVAWLLAWRKPDQLNAPVGIAMSVVIVAVAVAMSVQMYRVGEMGAKAVWNHSITLGAGEGTENGDDGLVPAPSAALAARAR